MTTARQSAPGATRTCPHCRATILESASVCPACRHHLRSGASSLEKPAPSFSPFTVEGTIRHPGGVDPWEYSVLLSIRDDRGNEITRQVIGVGSIKPTERRSFSLAVQVFTPGESRAMR